MIHAADPSTAENVQQLIYGGILLAYPDVNSNESPHPPLQNGLVKPELIVGSPWCAFFSHSDNAPVGCRIAKAAWADAKFIYAIEKLKLSWRLDWFTSGHAKWYEVHAELCLLDTALIEGNQRPARVDSPTERARKQE